MTYTLSPIGADNSAAAAGRAKSPRLDRFRAEMARAQSYRSRMIVLAFRAQALRSGAAA